MLEGTDPNLYGGIYDARWTLSARTREKKEEMKQETREEVDPRRETLRPARL